jgi:hypothetical protein
MYRMNIAKGILRRPGADMDTLGFIGYSGMGHRFPESRSLENANHPLRFRTNEAGAVWISFGAEYLPLNGSDAEFNIGTLKVDFAAISTALRSRGKPNPVNETGLRPGIFQSGARAWNLAGERVP